MYNSKTKARLKKITDQLYISTEVVYNPSDPDNKHQLLCTLLPMIMQLTNRHCWHEGVDIDDLYQEGVLAVYDAYYLYENKQYALRDRIVSQITDDTLYIDFVEILERETNHGELVDLAKQNPELFNSTGEMILWVVDNAPRLKFSSFAWFYINNRMKSFINNYKKFTNVEFNEQVVNDILLTEKLEREHNYEMLFRDIPKKDRRLIEAYFGIACERRNLRELAEQHDCSTSKIFKRIKEIKEAIYENWLNNRFVIPEDL